MTKPVYLLDANVLIHAHNLYYSIDMVPEFWAWLLHMAQLGNIAMPLETYEEVAGGPDNKEDLLKVWLKDDSVKSALVLNEEIDTDALDYVMKAYAKDLTDTEIDQLGRDPFLISYGIVANGRIVVSNEVSKPSKQRANQKVPDICKKVGAPCCNTFTMLRQLGFKTSWAA